MSIRLKPDCPLSVVTIFSYVSKLIGFRILPLALASNNSIDTIASTRHILFSVPLGRVLGVGRPRLLLLIGLTHPVRLPDVY